MLHRGVLRVNKTFYVVHSKSKITHLCGYCRYLIERKPPAFKCKTAFVTHRLGTNVSYHQLLT